MDPQANDAARFQHGSGRRVSFGRPSPPIRDQLTAMGHEVGNGRAPGGAQMVVKAAQLGASSDVRKDGHAAGSE
jgi:gamma-glutamyltranspeptidase